MPHAGGAARFNCDAAARPCRAAAANTSGVSPPDLAIHNRSHALLPEAREGGPWRVVVIPRSHLEVYPSCDTGLSGGQEVQRWAPAMPLLPGATASLPIGVPPHPRTLPSGRCTLFPPAHSRRPPLPAGSLNSTTSSSKPERGLNCVPTDRPVGAPGLHSTQVAGGRPGLASFQQAGAAATAPSATAALAAPAGSRSRERERQCRADRPSAP